MDTMDWMPLNHLAHAALGTLTLAAGMLALWAVKGSTLHVRGGRVFAGAMALVVLTSLLSMFHRFLPLAVVLAMAEVYLVPSAVLSIRREQRGWLAWHVCLLLLAGVIALFCTMQFVRSLFAPGPVMLGALAIALVFWWLFAEDLWLLRRRPVRAGSWVHRHLARMILAFAIAVMALARIGIRAGLSLEATVVVPLVGALLAIAWMRHRYRGAARNHPESKALPGNPLESHSEAGT